MYQPDKWVMLKIWNKEKEIFKIFGSWSGGYLTSDSWRMNSGIKEIKEEKEYYDIYGYSGSIYRCYKGANNIHGYNATVLQQYLDRAKESATMNIEVVDIKEFVQDENNGIRMAINYLI